MADTFNLRSCMDRVDISSNNDEDDGDGCLLLMYSNPTVNTLLGFCSIDLRIGAPPLIMGVVLILSFDDNSGTCLLRRDSFG